MPVYAADSCYGLRMQTLPTRWPDRRIRRAFPPVLLCSALGAAVLPVPAGTGLAIAAQTQTRAAETRPKYGPSAVPLSRSSDYVRSQAAPDFWALMPYYLPQRDGRS